MHTTLRPYMTTGIALLGASVIAVVPATVPAPDLSSAHAAAIERTVTTDVALTASLADLIAAVPTAAALIAQAVIQSVPLPAEVEALASALANAMIPAVTETYFQFTVVIPNTVQNLIASGSFAHLPLLALNAAYTGIVLPVAPFLVALRENLPLPIGTADGLINEGFNLFAYLPFTTGVNLLGQLADIVDKGTSPVTAFAGALSALTSGIENSLVSVGKIVAAFGGALPVSPFAAMAKSQERTLAMSATMPAANDPNVVDYRADSLMKGKNEALTVTVDSSALEVTGETDGSSEATAVDESTARERLGDSYDSSGHATPNGATDLSDGNLAEPGTTDDGSAGQDDAGASGDADDAASPESASTAETSHTGSDEGSGDGEGSGE